MIVLAASVVAIGCPRKEEAPKRIILIVVDTLRRDHVSPYGSAVVTSNVQRLADAGVEVLCRDVGCLPWFDIDTPQDLQSVRDSLDRFESTSDVAALRGQA